MNALSDLAKFREQFRRKPRPTAHRPLPPDTQLKLEARCRDVVNAYNHGKGWKVLTEAITRLEKALNQDA